VLLARSVDVSRHKHQGNGMHFQSEFSTNALRRLERLAASLTTGRQSALAIAHSMRAMDSIFVDLGRRVANHDGLGIPGSEEELVFRTSRLIIRTQLDRIDQTIRGIGVADPPESAKSHVWRRFLDVIPLGKAELRRITRIWLAYRRVEQATSEPGHAAAYQLALRAAFDELHKMGEIPEIGRMLHRGVASVKWPEIVTACEQTLVAIGVRIELQAARQLWSAQRQWARVVDGGAPHA
jgi:hypothetical protein